MEERHPAVPAGSLQHQRAGRAEQNALSCIETFLYASSSGFLLVGESELCWVFRWMSASGCFALEILKNWCWALFCRWTFIRAKEVSWIAVLALSVVLLAAFCWVTTSHLFHFPCAQWSVTKMWDVLSFLFNYLPQLRCPFYLPFEIEPALFNEVEDWWDSWRDALISHVHMESRQMPVLKDPP